MNYIGRTSSLHFLTGTELHRNGEVHGGSMKNSKFKIHNSKYKVQNSIFNIQNSKYSKFKVQNIQYSKFKIKNVQNSKFIFPQQPSGLGFQSLYPGLLHCAAQFWRSARRQYELHRQNIIFQFSLHFLTGTELHRNGEVHGGSMKNSKFKKYSKFKFQNIQNSKFRFENSKFKIQISYIFF